MYTVRQLKAEDKDIDLLCALRQQALETNPEAFGSTIEEFNARDNRELFMERLGNSKPGAENLVFMAFSVAKNPVGMVGLVRETRDKTRHMAWVWGMFVIPEARKQGVSRRMMKKLFKAAGKMEGLEQINLSVITLNPVARAFYQRLGFDEYGIEPCALKYKGRCYDMVMMQIKPGREIL